MSTYQSKAELIEAAKDRLGTEDIGARFSFGKGAQVHDYQTGRDLEMLVNTDDVDSDREVVDPAGASMRYFEANGRKVFTDHKYGIMDVVGHARNIRKWPTERDHRGWKMRIGLLSTPLADTIATIVRETGQIGSSVMFQVLSTRKPTEGDKARYAKGGTLARVIERWELMEVSLTNLPANPYCQGGPVTDEAKAYMGEIERLLTKGAIKPEFARRLGLIESRKVLTIKPKRVLVFR